jgi:hypothetical protein
VASAAVAVNAAVVVSAWSQPNENARNRPNTRPVQNVPSAAAKSKPKCRCRPKFRQPWSLSNP